ncbi:MAG: 4-phosphopantetheinyl transferase superfamily protein [Myxococcaceae bacterium]|nr:4-phosphopantetheinyl transferase superfamily protein [Myxococcaceae bacterium]
MTEEERARRDRFVFEKNRVEFLATRALARTVLAAYTGLARDAVRFSIDAYGKPALDPALPGLSFNLSNALTLVVCAVADAPTVGVDVEPLARADQVFRVASDVFTATERAELASLDAASANRRAVELWTLKEAYMKARGLGMSLPPSSFAMAGLALASEPPPPDEPDRSRWTFTSLEVEAHAVAICVEARLPEASRHVEIEHVDVTASMRARSAPT